MVGWLRSRRSDFVVLGVACVVSVAAGALAHTRRAPLAVAALGVLALIGWLVRKFGRGCLIGLLILGCLDALPGPNLEVRFLNSLTQQDFVVAALGVVLLLENQRTRFRHLRASANGRRLVWWCLAFMCWYGFVIARTWISTPVPLEHAITFTREFPYFALLLPLLYGALRDPRLRNTILATLGIGAAFVAFTEVLTVAGHHSLSFLVHVEQGGTTEGLIRLYTSASDIPFAALPLGYGLVLYGHTARRQQIGAAIGLLSLLAIILGLTRAMYLGEAVGLAGATALAIPRGTSRGRVARRQFARTIGGLAAVIILVYAFAPSTSSTLNGVSARVESLVTILGTSIPDSSVRTRDLEISSVEYALVGHWFDGRGALDPTYDYVAGVPSGNIDQIDVSLLGAIAVIGIIGVSIYALPLLACLLGLFREQWESRVLREDDWIIFGGLAWCIAAMVVSPTLGLFFQPAQVAGSAVMLALIAGALTDRRTLRAAQLRDDHVDGRPVGAS
jgi:hypothetical protein